MNSSAITSRISGVMLGAGLLAFVYVVLTPRLLPDVVSFPESVSGNQIAAVRWLVGMVLGAIVMIAWHVLRTLVRQSRARG